MPSKFHRLPYWFPNFEFIVSGNPSYLSARVNHRRVEHPDDPTKTIIPRECHPIREALDEWRQTVGRGLFIPLEPITYHKMKTSYKAKDGNQWPKGKKL
eukprot:535946_1